MFSYCLSGQIELSTQYEYGKPFGHIGQYTGVDNENETIKLYLTYSPKSIWGEFIVNNNSIIFNGTEQNWIDSSHIKTSIEDYGSLNIEIINDSSLLIIYEPISALPEIRINLTEQAEPGIYPFDLLSYKATKLLIFNSDSSADTTHIESYHIMLVAPDHFDIATQKKINNAVRSIFPNATANSRYPYDIVRNYDELLIKEYLSQAMGESFCSNYESSNWFSDYVMSVSFNEHDLLGISNSYWTYTGGVHGMYGVSFYVYDMRQERLLNLEDIFVDGYDEQLATIINHQLLYDLNVDSTTSLSSLGYWEDKIPITSNYTIEENNIVFYYGPYEIASYATGPTIITIPLKSLQAIIRRDSPINRLLKP